MGEMKDRMLAGLPYIADDPDLRADALRARVLEHQYNSWPADDREGRDRVLRELLGSCGDAVAIRPPFHVDYGWRISIGAGTFVNFGGVFLDVAEIRIGSAVQMGPHVQLLTPTHPLDPEERRAGWESRSDWKQCEWSSRASRARGTLIPRWNSVTTIRWDR